MNRTPPEALRAFPPRGTTPAAGAGPAAVLPRRLLRGDLKGLLRGLRGVEL